MKRILTLLLLLLLSNSMVFGQSREIRLIEKQKYSKVEIKIDKELLSSPDDIGLNYAAALLIIKRQYKEYSPERSYAYLMKSKLLYEKLSDDKKIRSLNRVPINQSLFQNYTDTICRCALEDVIVVNNVEPYEKFLDFYKTAPTVYRNKAIENRDIAAFKIAGETNSLESYQFFISQYPDAVQKNDAVKKRNAFAFEKVKKVDNIDSYKEFINKYPNADEINQTWERIHELAFAQAEKMNTSSSYKKFIDENPNSKQYEKAFKMFEEKQFMENKINGDWFSFKAFIKNYPNNSWKLVAQDSIRVIGLRTQKTDILTYCIDSFTGTNRNDALMLYHDIFTSDGEKQTLDLFYNKYDDKVLDSIKIKDYALVDMANNLSLNLLYNSNELSKYDEYIRLAAPREKAFVALQRLISPDVARKDWKTAITKIKTYYLYFGTKYKKINDLISVLDTKPDTLIKINAVGKSVNAFNDGVSAPVISADNKYLYFCGKNKKANIVGSGVLVSGKLNGNWGTPKIIADLTFANAKDAPLSVSTDGTKMLLFKSGKLYYSEKTFTGWSEAIEFPQIINSGKWQEDAMISSDGKALFFASTKKDSLDLMTEDSSFLLYHGDVQRPLDIFVSVLKDNNEWGEPVNLGNVINTPFCDRSPFLHPDMKTLYFSSDGHGGLGKLDLFKTTRLSDTCWTRWSEPINMGKEINSEESDCGYKITTDGMNAYFAKRKSALENENILVVNLPIALRPDIVATISGKLFDIHNHSVAAEIIWEDLTTGKTVGRSKSDPADGSFFMVLPLGKVYGYYVKKEEYFPVAKNINLRINNEPVRIEENINMITFQQMVEDEIAVPINNLFFNFAESRILPNSIPELKRIASIIKSTNLKAEISGYTDNIGNDKQNQLLSDQRALAVKTFLVNEGCSEVNLNVIDYVKTQSVATDETGDGSAKNKRVELKFIK